MAVGDVVVCSSIIKSSGAVTSSSKRGRWMDHGWRELEGDACLARGAGELGETES